MTKPRGGKAPEAGGPAGWMSRTNASTGRIYFWPGGSLWIGRGQGRTEWHVHHAHQIVVVPTGQVRFRTDASGAWQAFDAAFVPSHRPHQFDTVAQPMAHLFVEPESRAGRALTERFGADAVAALPVADGRAAAHSLFEALAATPQRETMTEVAAQVLARLSGATTEVDRSIDTRLARALVYIRTHIREPITLDAAADAATLSASRFRHLFALQTGCSFRAYVLWQRINVAIESAAAGATWTQAAHEAGFADSAHLARTHKRMFGIEPTAVRVPSAAGNGVGT
ncbi:MAG: helix-turn-helix transcriptional regulator [Piscinibacter sp.]|uniref:helix-turn-helix domain-containing protein n=1 Tax=Piscinibacter sp. TaxID=1903157 RepID=UPI0025896CE4|nr:AraC family transcriptional regulator [Piscinibacter sp.]MCW5664044.1 helix-turn-helix transcriptional regulator [Piscinibacter sp.]